MSVWSFNKWDRKTKFFFPMFNPTRLTRLIVIPQKEYYKDPCVACVDLVGRGLRMANK